MKYKLICSDLDDTLITDDGRLTDEVKRAVKRYTDAGGRFCIVTGRMTIGAIPVAKELKLNGDLIAYQGSVTYDLALERVTDEICISVADATEIGRFMEERNFYYQTYVGDVFITQKANDYTVLYGRISNAEYKETVIPLSQYIERENINPPKLLLLEDPERVPKILAILKDRFGEKFRINTSKPYIIEIIPKTVSKAVAVDCLVKKYGITKDEVICIGDSENDIPMIEYAGMGVAVNNAGDAVKKIADVIAPSNEENGVAWVIDNIALKK